MIDVKIGLFFGSFNPIHNGHLIIANHMVEDTDLDEIWMVLSPQNPFKDIQSLAPETDRKQMLKRAVRGNKRVKTSFVEFDLPKPSYTINTLQFLKKKRPKDNFVLIMGEDNLAGLKGWKSIDLILKDYPIYVYRRPDSAPHPYEDHHGIRIFDFPTINISATYIRNRIAQGKSVQYLVPTAVYNYLNKYGIYADGS